MSYTTERKAHCDWPRTSPLPISVCTFKICYPPPLPAAARRGAPTLAGSLTAAAVSASKSLQTLL